MTEKLNIKYDHNRDIVEIEGINYSGEFFRVFSMPEEKALYQITHNDGVVTLTEYKKRNMKEIVKFFNTPSIPLPKESKEVHTAMEEDLPAFFEEINHDLSML